MRTASGQCDVWTLLRRHWTNDLHQPGLKSGQIAGLERATGLEPATFSLEGRRWSYDPMAE
jgi:hypothetical protein